MDHEGDEESHCEDTPGFKNRKSRLKDGKSASSLQKLMAQQISHSKIPDQVNELFSKVDGDFVEPKATNSQRSFKSHGSKLQHQKDTVVKTQVLKKLSYFDDNRPRPRNSSPKIQ